MHTDCNDPAALREGELAAYLDDSAAPHVGRHLAACPACASELAALQQTAATLHAALGRDDCPEPDTLLSHANGWLADPQRSATARHVAGCIACQAELRLLNEAQGDTFQPAASSWSQAAGLAPLLATRRSAVNPPQPGRALRGDHSAPHIYEAAGFHLTLEVLPGPDQRWTIQGTLIPTADGDPSGAPAYLIRNGAIAASDGLDELGFFSLTVTGDAVYSLQIDTLPQPVIVAELALQP